MSPNRKKPQSKTALSLHLITAMLWTLYVFFTLVTEETVSGLWMVMAAGLTVFWWVTALRGYFSGRK